MSRGGGARPPRAILPPGASGVGVRGLGWVDFVRVWRAIAGARLLLLLVATGLILDIGGVLHVYGFVLYGGSYQQTGHTVQVMATRAALALFVLAGCWLAVCPARRAPAPLAPPSWLGLLPPLAATLCAVDVLGVVGPDWSPAWLLVSAGGVIVLTALALCRAPAAIVAYVALILGSTYRLVEMWHVSISTAGTDMLPLTLAALDKFFAGHSPYTTHFVPWALPLTYLPLTWLAYAPAFLLGLDIRWTNIVAEVALLGAALFVARHAGGGGRRRAASATLLLWAWFFLSPAVRHWDMVTTAPIGWAAIAWTLALIASGRHRAAAVVLGLTAGTTLLIGPIVPLIAFCWWREAGVRTVVGRGVLAAVVAGVVLLPFFLWAPGPFLDGTILWFNDLDRMPRGTWQDFRTWAGITGFSGLFWARGWEGWLKPIQGALVALVSVLYAVRGASRADLTRHVVGAYLLFTLFNPVLWPYLYNPALVAALLAVAADGVTLDEGARVTPRQRAESSAVGHPAD